MPPPGPWTWGITVILATSVAVKQRREHMARLVAVTSTTTATPDPPDPPDWAQPTTPMVAWKLWVASTTSPPQTPMGTFQDSNQDVDSESIDDEFFESDHVTENTDPATMRVGDLVSPLHGLFFEDEETISAEQFGGTLIGILLSAVLGQFRKIAVSLLKLVLVVCPRLHLHGLGGSQECHLRTPRSALEATPPRS